MTRAETPEFPATPALVVGTVSHSRRSPLRHAFKTAQYQWLVDLDELPRLKGALRFLARFDPRDHLEGGARGGTKGDVLRLLAERGVQCRDDDRVLMLANARVFGHVFNPLTVYWCVSAGGSPRAVVLEVHNTYGGRHSYVVEPDAGGRASVEKQFPVSPFNDTAGTYDVNLRVSPTRLAIAIGLTRAGERFFNASFSGSAIPASRTSLLKVAVRQPLITLKVSLLIRVHGIRLWLAGLPVLRNLEQPEPDAPPSAPKVVRAHGRS